MEVKVTEIQPMERLYVRNLNGSPTYSVYLRPTHEFIECVPKDTNGMNRLKELCAMSCKEFYTFLLKQKTMRLPTSIEKYSLDDSQEEWYNKAWKKDTMAMGLTIPVESMPFDLIKEAIEWEHKTQYATYKDF